MNRSSRSLNTEHLLATLSGSFGTLALVLSLVGLYGVMSFVVTQRSARDWNPTGARRRPVGRLNSAGASGCVGDDLLGIGIGLLLVSVLGRLVQAQLYDVKSFDPTAIVITVLILCSAGVGAALIPAHRASGVSPTEALRVE